LGAFCEQEGGYNKQEKHGIPTDNGYAEQCVGVFKLAVAERTTYRTLGEFLQTAEHRVNFYNQQRPHEGLGNRSPDQYAQKYDLPLAFISPYVEVHFFGYLTFVVGKNGKYGLCFFLC
jgi:hypothetical protein